MALALACAAPEPEPTPAPEAEVAVKAAAPPPAPSPPTVQLPEGVVDPSGAARIATVRRREVEGLSIDQRLALAERHAEAAGLVIEAGLWGADPGKEGGWQVEHTWQTDSGTRVWAWEVSADGDVKPANSLARELEALQVEVRGEGLASLLGAGPPQAESAPAPPQTAVAAEPVPEPVSAPPPAAATYAPPLPRSPRDASLVGVMEIDGVRKAILSVDGESYTVRAGESAGGYRVGSINSESVTLSRGGESFLVQLQAPTAKPRPRPREAAPAAPPEEEEASPRDSDRGFQGGLPTSPEELEPGSQPAAQSPSGGSKGVPVDGSGYPRLPEASGYPGQ